MKILLEQDDCAPDSLEWFNTLMDELIELQTSDFHQRAKIERPDDLTTLYHLNGYVLRFDGDDPYYKLYKDE